MQNCLIPQLECQRLFDLAKGAFDNRRAGSIKSLPRIPGHCLLWTVSVGSNKALLGLCVTVTMARLIGRA